MNRRDFFRLTAAVAPLIVVPKFGSIVPAARFGPIVPWYEKYPGMWQSIDNNDVKPLTEADLNAAFAAIYDKQAKEIEDSVFMAELQRGYNRGMMGMLDQGRYVEVAHYFTIPKGVGSRAEAAYIPVSVPDLAPRNVTMHRVLANQLEQRPKRLLQGVADIFTSIADRINDQVGR